MVLLQRNMYPALLIYSILHISTKITPLYSSYFPPSTELSSMSVASLLLKLTYLAVLFDFKLTYTARHCFNSKINNIAKKANFTHNITTNVEFDLLDGRELDEYKGVSFVKTTKIFSTQDPFCFGTKTFDREYHLTSYIHANSFNGPSTLTT